MAFFLHSWSVAVQMFFVAAIEVAVLMFLQYKSYHVHLIWELFASVVRTVPQALRRIPILFSLLLAVILFSVFSGELWQALGTIAPDRMLITILLLLFPIVLIVRSATRGIVADALSTTETPTEMIGRIADIPYFRTKLDKVLISEEEWQQAKAELLWRHNQNVPGICKSVSDKTHRLFLLLLIVTTLFLVLLFWAYLFAFFCFLIDGSVIASWIDIPFDYSEYIARFLGHQFEFRIASTIVPLCKTSLLLSVFLGIIALIQAVTDEAYQAVFLRQLSERARAWIAVGALCESVTSPTYEVWEYLVDDKRTGRVNVSVVIPQGLDEEIIRRTCERVAARFEDYRHWVRVTAFEKRSDQSYRRGIPGKRWEYHQNKANGSTHFEAAHLDTGEEIRYKHFLGIERNQKGEVIPDEWFGETPAAVKLGRLIWEGDQAKDLILHPHITINDRSLVVADIQMTRRLDTSSAYEAVMQQLVSTIISENPDTISIMIALNLRETVDSLARLDIFRQNDFCEYKDEYMKQSRNCKPLKWWVSKLEPPN